MVPPIDKIPNHDVAFVGQVTTFFKHLQHIIKLTVNVPTQSHRCLDWLHVWLLEKQRLDFPADLFYGNFRKELAVCYVFDEGVDVHQVGFT